MKNVYKVKPYPVFRAHRDRGMRPDEATVSRMCASLERGETVFECGYKWQPISGGRVRVYSIRNKPMVSRDKGVRRI